MGTWDAGPFDNDTAADFAVSLDDVPEHQRAAMIRGVLTTVIDNDGYLDFDDGARAAAAAALVTSRLPGGDQFVPNGYDPASPLPDLPPSLIPLAVSAVDRVLSEDSELAGLWAEDTREPHRWRTPMLVMKTVLLAATVDAMDPLFEVGP